MSKRYMGGETITSRSQVIRYLQENYVDANGNPMAEVVAIDIVKDAEEDIDRGIKVFKSHVDYIGDEAVKNAEAPYTWLEADEDDYEDEDDDE